MPHACATQWLAGQDAMRVVKQRLREMVPDLSIFLEYATLPVCAQQSRPARLCRTQIRLRVRVPLAAGSVDDLKGISNLDGYIARANAVLIFCTDGYFSSRNCMIELRASVRQGKLIIPLVDPDASRGGLTQEQVHTQLVEAEQSLYAKWRLDDSGPSAEELFSALCANEAVEWNRIGAFQDV